MNHVRTSALPEYIGPYRVCFFEDGKRYLLYETWFERQVGCCVDTSDISLNSYNSFTNTEKT